VAYLSTKVAYLSVKVAQAHLLAAGGLNYDSSLELYSCALVGATYLLCL